MNQNNRHSDNNRNNQSNKRRSSSQSGRSGQQKRQSKFEGGPQDGVLGRAKGGRSRKPQGKFQGGSQGRPYRAQGKPPGRAQDKQQNIETREAGPADRLEGRNPIKEALRAGRNINKVWIKRRGTGRYDQDLTRLVQDTRKAGAVIVEVDSDVLDSMATSYGHQGIIAQVAAHEYVTLAELIVRGEAQMAENIYPLLILLDGLEESYNLGSILRIADAAGATGIIIPERRSVALDAAVAKASAGAIEYVPVARVTNLSNAIQELKDAGYWIYGSDAQGTATPEDSDWLRKIALVIGSEGKGMGMKISEACDHLIRIPQYGEVNSLNAAVACGILVFEARRQVRHADEGAAPSPLNLSETTKPGEDLLAGSKED
ncbi:MAG: 23S rRNA (guanosine(2251)-2'-O)-methyltransferase RlmB [Clostridiaceae bacterium]|nr:23S rRNA (guanosine(2251)-2'-O)-methyltransferase RlmB [Clostridiaceae bacterium]